MTIHVPTSLEPPSLEKWWQNYMPHYITLPLYQPILQAIFLTLVWHLGLWDKLCKHIILIHCTESCLTMAVCYQQNMSSFKPVLPTVLCNFHNRPYYLCFSESVIMSCLIFRILMSGFIIFIFYGIGKCSWIWAL